MCDTPWTDNEDSVLKEAMKKYPPSKKRSFGLLSKDRYHAIYTYSKKHSQSKRKLEEVRNRVDELERDENCQRAQIEQIEQIDDLSSPPEFLRSKPPSHSKLGPNDTIAKPLGPDTGEMIPAICPDCRKAFNYARGHECDALPSFDL